MKIRVYENGLLAGARFFPLLDGVYLSILKTGAREEFLHGIQRKYVAIATLITQIRPFLCWKTFVSEIT